jgi:hypothetical protein
MITTRVTWEYSIATQEQKDANLAFEQARANPELATVANASVHDELQEKTTELLGGAEDNTTGLEIEKDEVAEIVRHIRTRNWADLASAQQWIAFVLAKGAKSAVIVEG